jgi:protein-S-isoprenylcysteine O-methyltransferase Ste14
VVRGLYRWVRHPLYTAGLVLIWLTPVMTLNIFSLNLGLTIYLVVGALIEERKLVREYGEAYEEYRKRTPMLIPDFPQSEGGNE